MNIISLRSDKNLLLIEAKPTRMRTVSPHATAIPLKDRIADNIVGQLLEIFKFTLT
jgi:hypothetical protein